ncbi:hypothetical protein R1T14_33775 [Flavitalea sp. BT771]|nr:hypothetical protein [Flavitalea sp. BT771]
MEKQIRINDDIGGGEREIVFDKEVSVKEKGLLVEISWLARKAT